MALDTLFRYERRFMKSVTAILKKESCFINSRQACSAQFNTVLSVVYKWNFLLLVSISRGWKKKKVNIL